MAEIVNGLDVCSAEGGASGEAICMLRQQFNSAPDTGVVNFYDAANRCKIAKQKKILRTHTHNRTHTQGHRQAETFREFVPSARPEQTQWRPPGYQSAAVA